MPRPVLSAADHDHLTTFLYAVLDEHREGRLSRTSAMSEIAHVVAAVDRRNIAEARAAVRRAPEE